MAEPPGFAPATPEDADYWAELMTAAHPDDPWDPDQLRHDWRFEDRDEVVRRWVLLDGQRRAGFAELTHVRWERTPERFAFVNARLSPDAAGERLLPRAYDELETLAAAEGAKRLQATAREDDATRVRFLQDRGYRRDRLERVWELDLVANRERILGMAESSRRRMREQGVELLTLDRWDEPDTYRKLYDLDMSATADIPSTDTFVPHDFDDWQLWFTKPSLHKERFWLAREEGRLLGLSVLLFPRRGAVTTDFTGVAREARGRGIARALKCETLVQAIELGVRSVRTDNDAENAPILHLNADFGYRPRPGWIAFLKDVK
jgi:ribosomal protein S18 acetylase RimI-like enzyme